MHGFGQVFFCLLLETHLVREAGLLRGLLRLSSSMDHGGRVCMPPCVIFLISCFGSRLNVLSVIFERRCRGKGNEKRQISYLGGAGPEEKRDERLCTQVIDPVWPWLCVLCLLVVEKMNQGWHPRLLYNDGSSQSLTKCHKPIRSVHSLLNLLGGRLFVQWHYASMGYVDGPRTHQPPRLSARRAAQLKMDGWSVAFAQALNLMTPCTEMQRKKRDDEAMHVRADKQANRQASKRAAR
jgi:hypothetical protein